MYEYKCKVCKGQFEDSIVQERCKTFKCQSRQIKDVTPTVKGVTYSNFEQADLLAGVEYEQIHDRQARHIRNQFLNDIDYLREILNNG